MSPGADAVAARTFPAEEAMREAVATRDASYDGRFVYGVVTTGVFCRPSCPSRAARPENLRFFADVGAAAAAGFRACRRCHPAGADPATAVVSAVARYVEANADRPLTLAHLAERAGLSPARLQRLFKATLGVTPRAYRQAVRARGLKRALRAGEDVAGAAYGAGYGSSSRLYEEGARHIGMTPAAYRAGGAGETVHYACRRTTLGPLLMGATRRGVCFVQFGDDEEALLAALRREFPQASLVPSPARQAPELDVWMDALDEHLSRGAALPDVPLDLRGTAFQVRVWRFLLSVREGEVVSYAEVAAAVGRPAAMRAVGSACGANRIAVLVPCHRVLRGDGGLGGYRWGLERKRALLDGERRAGV